MKELSRSGSPPPGLTTLTRHPSGGASAYVEKGAAAVHVPRQRARGPFGLGYLLCVDRTRRVADPHTRRVLRRLAPEERAQVLELLDLEPDRRGGQLQSDGTRERKYHAGRPAQLISYFLDGRARLEEPREVTLVSGRVEFPARPVAPPTLEGFAAEIGISRRTLGRWASKHREFGEALERAKTIEAACVLELAYTRAIDPRFASFVLRCNHDYLETRRVEVEHGLHFLAVPGGPLDDGRHPVVDAEFVEDPHRLLGEGDSHA